MKKTFILIILFFASSVFTYGDGRYFSKVETGASPPAISDDFNRADNPLGANWTVNEGTLAISSNQFAVAGAAEVDCAASFNAASTTTVNQWLRVVNKTTLVSGDYVYIDFRLTNSSNFVLVVFERATNVVWWATIKAGTFTYMSSSAALGNPIADDVIGITVIGTGNNIVIRIWKNATGAAPDAGGATWGSASPGVTFSDDPGTANLDTGNMLGLGGNIHAGGSANDILLDDFSGGDVP